MKNAIIFMTVCVITMSSIAKGNKEAGNGHVNSNNHTIRGHSTESRGYVAPSHATNRNNTKSDNYTQKGNVNPYTGKEGTKK